MKPLVIEEMFAFIAENPDVGEGIVGMTVATGWIPFVGADMARVEDLMPHAREIARMTGRTVKVIRFSTRTELETITP